MNLTTRILLLNVGRILGLLLMTLCGIQAALLIPAVMGGESSITKLLGIFVGVAVAGYVLRSVCVSETKKVMAKDPEAAQLATAKAAALYKYIWLGSLVGGAVGFLVRPAAGVVGQLPLMVVITRGAQLTGMDRLLVPVAQTSFNYLMAGCVIGMAGGFVLTKLQIKE